MNAKTIRCINDLKLFDTLREHADVKRVCEHIAREEEKGPMGIRRHLLATSVRLSQRMAKSVNMMADECAERLDMDIPIELYVFASPQYNAMCFKPEEGRLFVMFSSSLLEAFEGSELRFVIGHEFGHYIYHHHDIPIGYILKGGSRPDPKLALELFAWSRYAEISADRAGAYCAQDLNGVGSALFKLASGLSNKIIEFNLEDFIQQVDEMQIVDAEPGQGAKREDWFSTHPFSPLRVKALQLFDNSEYIKKGGEKADDLEVSVQGLMSLMEPSYIEGRTDTAENMRRLLFAGSIVVAAASGEISEEEKEVFEKFFGEGSFREKYHIEKLKADLPARINTVKEQASIPQRMQVLRDLCLIARAEDHACQGEREVLEQIATALDVPPVFVSQSLKCDLEPD